MKNLKLLFLLFFFTNLIFSQTNLTVSDPQQWWSRGQGSIDEAVFSIQPEGIYSKIGMYLTFSAKNLYFNHSDTLEIVLDFDLPKESIVTDLWLWVGDTIMKAKVLDKWTASNIYEDIVGRRRDPAILFKNDDNSYKLRIFPMAGDESRKIKLEYLVKNEWLKDKITVPIPTNILRTTNTPTEIINFRYFPNAEWKNPAILELPSYQFTEVSDTNYTSFFQVTIPHQNVYSSLNISFSSPMKNGVYYKYYEKDDEGYYQLAFNPTDAVDINSFKRVMFLLDYDVSNTNISKSDFINSIKNLLKSDFSNNDFFNVGFSQLDVKTFSENWLVADSTTIEEMFDNFKTTDLADYSNLPILLNKGLEFIQNSNEQGSIVLISSSDQFGDFSLANSLLADIKEKSNYSIAIYSVDIANTNVNNYWFGGRSYRGNEYLYLNLARLTGANNKSIFNNNYSSILSETISSLNGFISSFDLHTKMGNGFCYARYNFTGTDEIYLNKPIYQVGKFFGEFPFIAEASGLNNGEPFSINISVDNIPELKGDSTLVQLWTGNHIKNLEKLYNNSNEEISEIINYSIDENIMSLYTAFLALEPGQQEPCFECIDESIIVTATEETSDNKDSLTVTANPNPFNATTNIEVNLNKNFALENASFKIYNVLGQVVKSYNNIFTNGERKFSFSWDGKNDRGALTSSGIYFFVISNNVEKHTLKLLMLK